MCSSIYKGEETGETKKKPQDHRPFVPLPVRVTRLPQVHNARVDTGAPPFPTANHPIIPSVPIFQYLVSSSRLGVSLAGNSSEYNYSIFSMAIRKKIKCKKPPVLARYGYYKTLYIYIIISIIQAFSSFQSCFGNCLLICVAGPETRPTPSPKVSR